METNLLFPDINQLAEVTISYSAKVKASQRPIVTQSRDAYNLLLAHWDKDKIEFVEQFKILLLNQGNKVLGQSLIGSGGITGTVADPRVVFALALKTNSCNLILAHNHPSGNLNPSQADRDLTRKFKGAGEFLDIKVLDHLIVTPEGYYSFADEGLL